MTTFTKHIGSRAIVLLGLLAAGSLRAEPLANSMDSRNAGCRISRGKAEQLASALVEVAGPVTDEGLREIRETVLGVTNQTSVVSLGMTEVQRIRTWLHEHHAQDRGLSEKVDYLLVALGDTNALSRVLTILRSGHPADRLDVTVRLSQSEQPLVIAALSQDLFIEEPAYPVKAPLPEIRMDPPSVTATRMINAILAASPTFTEETRSWANGLLQLTLEKRRDILRRWWKKNEQRFVSGEFTSVVPLSEGESSIKGEDYLQKRRPIRRIE